MLARPAVRAKVGELQSKIDALSDTQALELRHFEFLLCLCHHLGLNDFLFPLGARVASQDGPLLGSVALTACCRRSTSASLSATWARFGSSSRARLNAAIASSNFPSTKYEFPCAKASSAKVSRRIPPGGMGAVYTRARRRRIQTIQPVHRPITTSMITLTMVYPSPVVFLHPDALLRIQDRMP